MKIFTQQILYFMGLIIIRMPGIVTFCHLRYLRNLRLKKT